MSRDGGDREAWARELLARVGLGDTAADASFASPFRYDRQALLYVAPDLPDPTHDAFATRAAARMAELCAVTAGRALLLFTSFRNQEMPDFTRGIYDARALAMTRLSQQARALGAHGVVGVTIERSHR